MGDLDDLFQLCEFKDVKIITLRSGRDVTLVDVGVKGIINAVYVDGMKHNILRAQRNRAKEGKLVGMSYGYKMRIRDGREVTGRRDIEPKNAEVVLDIFKMYGDGHSLGSIVRILNSKGILSPGKKLWTKSRILGARTRNEGILRNNLYRGRAIWNMKSYRYNPITGGRNTRMNSNVDWEVSQQEDLRIVPEELWIKCQNRIIREQKIYDKKTKLPKPSPERFNLKNPLRDLVYCGVCNSTKTVANNTRYVCSKYKSSRACNNSRGLRYAEIIVRVFDELKRRLAMKASQDWHKDFKNVISQAEKEKHETQLKLDELDQKIANTVSLIQATKFNIDEIAQQLRKWELERIALKEKEPTVIEIDDNPSELLIEGLDTLENNLLEPQKDDSSRIFLVPFLERITLKPTEQYRGESISVEIKPNAWFAFYALLKKNKSN